MTAGQPPLHNASLRVLSGARKGHVFIVDAPFIRIGRDTGFEVRFDPERDLVVSTRHASITFENDEWWLRDTDSLNGTYVNGHRISDPTKLADGDQITFGLDGPLVEFRTSAANKVLGFDPGSSPTTRVSAAFSRQIRHWRLATSILTVVLVATVGVLLLNAQRARKAWEDERNALQSRLDSAMAASESTIKSLRGDNQGLADALRATQQRARGASAQLARAQRSGADAELPALRNEVRGALSELRSQELAARLDYESIRRRNDKAVVKIFVESANGEVSEGTGFAVRPDATFLVSRHLVSPDGRPAARLAVQFSYSDQVWPARLLTVDRQNDLAVLKVDQILGSVPVVQMISSRPDTIAQGSPVVLIGYPGGGLSTSSERPGRMRITPITGLGSVTAQGKNLEVQGYGATGSSGSPVFDRNGEVIGIVFGGRRAGGKHYVLAVASSAALRLLSSMSPP